jgi:serine acetyltransferase
MTALIGYGSHGKDIEAIYLRTPHYGRPLEIYDADPALGCLDPASLTSGDVILGVNDPIGRRLLAESLAPGVRAAFSPLIDPSAVIGVDIRLGGGVVIAPNASILRSVTLGPHVHANYGSSMTRCVVGAFSTLSPGATICGDVEIGEEVLIGANATVCDRVRIGNRVRVGAGAIIPPLSIIPDDATVIGVWKG